MGPVPVMMKPPIPTLAPVCTRIRVERLRACAAAMGVGVGVALGVGVGVVAKTTVVDAVKLLLPGLGSNAADEAAAVLLSVPASVGVTTKVTVVLLKAVRVPKLQVISLVPKQLP